MRHDIGVLDLENEETDEYLVDLCWSPRQSKDAEVLASWIELALESELSAHDIDSITNDFWKLTDVKAYMKVGIFSPLLRDRKKVLDTLSSAVAYHSISVPTERYLIILIIDHGQKETESQRIEVEGYEIDYLGELKKLGSQRFPPKLL